MEELVISISVYVFLGIPVWFWGFIIFCLGCLIWAFIDKNKRNKKYWEEHDLKKATPMTHHGTTQSFGTATFVISPHKWVIIDWDKHKNYLNIWEPKHTYKTATKYKLAKGTLNWKITEVPKVYTTIEQHFKRQVM
jgi:hypothetical protein